MEDKPEVLKKIQNHCKKSLSDAAANCVNEQPIKLLTRQPLLVTCKGHGNRQAVLGVGVGFRFFNRIQPFSPQYCFAQPNLRRLILIPIVNHKSNGTLVKGDRFREKNN